MFLSIILAGYAVAILIVTHKMAAEELPGDFVVTLSNPANPFVTEQEVRANVVAALPEGYTAIPLNSIDLQAVENSLKSIVNIEDANVSRVYKADKAFINVEVAAMKPVARIFDNGKSYYINRAGKRLTANYRYKVDVPVVMAHFTQNRPATYIIPFIDYLNSDDRFNSLVSSVEVRPDGDIIIYPMVTNCRINFGDTTLIKDKVLRIMLAYSKIIPKRGWDYYDTISVKWDGQIVAHRRFGPPVYNLNLQDADENEAPLDFNYMDTVTINQSN